MRPSSTSTSITWTSSPACRAFSTCWTSRTRGFSGLSIARPSRKSPALGRRNGAIMAKPPSTSPFKVMEEEAYHAFLEWPVWLVLREKELAAYLAAHHPPADPRAAQGARAAAQSDKED